MEAIETAIRTALEKGNAQNRAFREKVYRSAHAALERALSAKEAIPPEFAEQRRQGLIGTIKNIESEFEPALPAEDDPLPAKPAPDIKAEIRPEQAEASKAPPVEIEPRPQPATVKKRARRERAERPRRSFATMFMIVLVLAAAGIGAWWTVQSGILLSPEERDLSVPNPPRLLESENFRPDRPRDKLSGNEKSSLTWITIFEPANSTEVSVPAGTDAMLVERDGLNYLRVRASGDAEVRFDVGLGTLERIAGETVLFSISARGEEGVPIQFAVGCDLAELGNCGRKRYEAGSTLAEFLFEIEVPEDRPSRSGSLTIDPDISNSGLAIDIQEIRVAVSD